MKKLLHDYLKWGFPKAPAELDIFQSTYSCKFCNRYLAQDSNGDYFHLSREIPLT